MRLKTVTAGDAVVGEQCEHCCRRAQPGQVVIYKPVKEGRLTKRVMLLHVRCVRQLVADAPDDADEQEFLRLKTLIHTTREAFPE